MFHTVSVNARSRGGLSRHYSGSGGEVNWKGPLRCGILFCTLSCILIVIGIILTWLGGHDVFGESVPITGPILLSVGGLLALLALRQFYLAQVLKKRDLLAQAKVTKEKEALAADEEAANLQTEDETPGNGDEDEFSRKPDIDSSTDYSSKSMIPYNPSSHTAALANHNPYYCMAMMVYKDPTLTFGPFMGSQAIRRQSSLAGQAEPCGSSNIPDQQHALPGAPVASSSTQPDPRTLADLPSTSSGGEPSGLSPQESGPSQPSTSLESSAVLQTTSTTLPYSNRPPVTKTISAPVYSSTTYYPVRQDFRKNSDSHTPSPSDYLNAHQVPGTSGVSPNAGIHNLPNPTAFMMLQTLEIQETI